MPKQEPLACELRMLKSRDLVYLTLKLKGIKALILAQDASTGELKNCKEVHHFKT